MAAESAVAFGRDALPKGNCREVTVEVDRWKAIEAGAEAYGHSENGKFVVTITEVRS